MTVDQLKRMLEGFAGDAIVTTRAADGAEHEVLGCVFDYGNQTFTLETRSLKDAIEQTIRNGLTGA